MSLFFLMKTARPWQCYVPRPKHPEFGHLGTSHPASGLVLQRDQERAGQGLTSRDDHEDGNIWV